MIRAQDKDGAYRQARQLARTTGASAIVCLDEYGAWCWSPGNNAIARERAVAIVRPDGTTYKPRKVRS
jgi:hypothetical protein